MSSLTGVNLARRLTAAANAVRPLDLFEPGNTFGIDITTDDAPPDLAVHSCQPAQLARVASLYPDANQHVDDDGILRWLEVETDGAAITFYRR